jgi:hypothetical protein
LSTHDLRILFAFDLNQASLANELAKVENRESDADGHSERGRRRRNEDGDEETNGTHRYGGQRGSAQQAWEGICGQVF